MGPRIQISAPRRGAACDSGLIVELLRRPSVEPHEAVVKARELLAHAFREYEIAGGTK